MTIVRRPLLLIVLAAVVLASACAGRGPEVAPAVMTSAEAPAQPKGPVTMVLAVQNEPINFMAVPYGGSPSQGGTQHGRYVVHNFMVVQDEAGAWIPQLAVEKPAVEKGTWVVNSDGTMDVTWRIHPNVKWHDGTPFTSEDLAFTLMVKTDREMPWPRGTERLVSSSSTPDPHTFVMHWSSLFNQADETPIVEPLPKHLLLEPYLADKQNLGAHPYLSTQFVGLGPYRLINWERGSHMEFVRFDDFYRGRPPLDRVLIKFLGDPNTLVANILAGEVDVVLPSSVEVDAALEVRKRWEGTGNQVRFALQGILWYMQLQARPEYARPANGLTNRTVRQALYQAIDRPNLAEVMTAGLAPTADSWLEPTHPMRAQLESAIPSYPYDPARSRQLLQEAGWVLGPGGTLVDPRTQAPFELEVWGRQGRGETKIATVVADNWNDVGVQAKPNFIPAARVNDAEYVNTHPGAYTNTQSKAFDTFFTDKLHSRNAPTPANRWQGTNRGGYSNPRLDSLLDQLVGTIDPRERLPLMRAALQEQLGEVALMPLFWDVSPVLSVRGVSGPITADKDVIALFYQWRKD
jgi:peptide/nickel transport system substrate-binding protein